MSWLTGLENVLGSAGGTASVLWLANYLRERSFQKDIQRHNKEQAEKQNVFFMGATSHMATGVFDKYVEFCEEYVAAMSEALPTLLGEESARTPLDGKALARVRQKVRQKWALWLSDEIENTLDKFERRIPRIHAEAPVMEPSGVIASSTETSVKSVIGELRKVLATEELNALRGELVARYTGRQSTLRH